MNNIPNKINPLPNMLLTIGLLPSSYIVSMTYEEQLLWLCNFLKTEVIPKTNANIEAVNQLISYIDNYFNNLDVQEEIDHKLDEMLEQGTLQEIITEYLQINGVLGYDTVADMISATNIINGSICRTLGLNSYNDGKGEFYKIRTITSGDIVDGVNIIALNISNTLIAEKMPNYDITNIKNKLNLITNKKYIFIGDSYLEGFSTAGTRTNFGQICVNTMGLSSSQYIINGVGGTGFTTSTSWDEMLDEMTSDTSVTDIVVCGGYNDLSHVGENTITTAMTNFKNVANTKFPNAKIHIGYIAWSNLNNHYELVALRDIYKKVTKKLGLNWIPNIYYVLHNYNLITAGDEIHPTQNGQNELGYALAEYLLNGTCDVSYTYTNMSITYSNNWSGDTVDIGFTINNNVTSVYSKVKTILKNSGDISFNGSGGRLEIGTLNGGYIKGSQFQLLHIPVTLILSNNSTNFCTRPGEIQFTDGKIYVSSLCTPTYSNASAFDSMTIDMIQICKFTGTFDTDWC